MASRAEAKDKNNAALMERRDGIEQFSGRRKVMTVAGMLLAGIVLAGISPQATYAQPAPPPAAAPSGATPATEPATPIDLGDDDSEGPIVSDSGAGYIDNAIVGHVFRFRYDASYNNPQPGRAEFFWPVAGGFGPGPGPDPSVDYQDFSAYLELLMLPRLSVFIEAPARLLNPELRDNTAGLGDSNIGFKYALSQDSCSTITAQFRVYLPTGDGDRGLGTDHASLEPALLHYRRLSQRMAFFAELRDWIAVGGTPNFAGNVLRYGLGTSYQLNDCDACRPLSAVFEVVGWTVLEGATGITTFPPLQTQFTSAVGDTIVNAKVGLRWQLTPDTDLYAGYGHALTHETWYEDNFRIELRWLW
jgi:hypothetical protein